MKIDGSSCKKLYIIFTYDIHPIGGTQMFVAGMQDFLHKQGFDVAVFLREQIIENVSSVSWTHM